MRHLHFSQMPLRLQLFLRGHPVLILLNNIQLRESPGIKEKNSLFELQPQNDL